MMNEMFTHMHYRVLGVGSESSETYFLNERYHSGAHFLEINSPISYPATGRCSTGFQDSRGYAWFRLDVKSDYLFPRKFPRKTAQEWNPLKSRSCVDPALSINSC